MINKSVKFMKSMAPIWLTLFSSQFKLNDILFGSHSNSTDCYKILHMTLQLCCHRMFLARWLTLARAYRIGGRKLCPSVCLYVKRYLLLQFCTDYNQTWINMIWAVAAKTLLSQIFHNWRRIEVNCVYISHCKWYRTSAGMPACIPNRRCCAGQCAGQ